VFQPSSNDPYAITTNLKNEKRNILQLAEKRIFTIRLAKQHLKASKESLDAWPSVYSEDQNSEYAETFKEVQIFCDHKLAEVCHVVSLLINCEADINKLGFVPQNLAIVSSTLDHLNEDQKNLFQQEEQTINQHPDETYSHLIKKSLTKYLEEANHIQQKLRETLHADERTPQKSNPYLTCIPELQKSAEHSKKAEDHPLSSESQESVCFS